MATAEGVFPKIGNDPIYNSEINDFHNPIKEIYTGSGFDSVISASTGTDIQDHELNAVTATGRNYVKVKITGEAKVKPDEVALVNLKAQIKEIGGSYADILAYKRVLYYDNNRTIRKTCTYEIIGALTPGMKTNGFQIKVFSQSLETSSTGTASFTNIQTVVELG